MPWQISGDKMKATLLNHMGDDNTVVDAARVSFKKGHKEFTEEQNHKLIKYLADHEHYSPFGHCFASFHVKAPVFVRAQLVKHAYLRMNEVSRRYVDDTPEFYDPIVWRGRAKNKKQGSDGEIEDPDYCSERANRSQDSALETYELLLQEGVAPEMARMVLPQSMYTEWYWSGSLDAFANMAKLRCKPDTQEETRLIANQISEQMLEKFPVSWSNLCK
jgi:thymidylate synthase (FAD)